MSAISGASTSASLLYLAIQSSASGQCDEPSMDSPARAGNAPASQDLTAVTVTQASPLGDLRSQIETAVTNSLNQLPANSSPEDIFKAVRSAVDGTLKANGLDPNQVTGHNGGHHHHHHAGGAEAALSNLSGTQSASDPDANSDDSQLPTDPLLAALSSAAGTNNRSQTATDGSTAATIGQLVTPANSLLALVASGPSAIDALSTLVQQLTGGGSHNGQSGSPSQSSPLLTALQTSSSGKLNLTDIFQQLFQNFPNGTGLDIQA